MPMPNPVYPNNQSRLPDYAEPGGIPPADEPTYHRNLAPVGRAETRSNLALNTTAERVGNAVGSAVDKVREQVKELPERLQEMKQRFTVIRGRARRDLSSRAGDLKYQAQRTVTQARTRAESLAHEQPLAVIGGAAAVGMALGIALRLWRDHAD